jgi:hypothetical protein
MQGYSEQTKILISSGCSFTNGETNWPTPLANLLNLKLKNVAESSQGNALISRKLIHAVESALTSYNSNEIIVGIVWSQVERSERYIEKTDEYCGPPYFDFNPTSVVDGYPNWRILRWEWINSMDSKLYYEIYNNLISSMVYTIEHILRVQWYLEKQGITYFMSSITDILHPHLLQHPEISYLYKQIDFSKFLPIKGEYEWVKENYPENGFNPPLPDGKPDWHPNKLGSMKFAEEVIFPFLLKKPIINKSIKKII